MRQLTNRRNFIKTATAGVAGASLLGAARGLAAPSNRLTAAVMGVNSRGGVLATAFARAEGCDVTHICDVDERAIAKSIKEVSEVENGNAPIGVTDIREVLENPDIDILVIAAPDHRHAFPPVKP